MHIFIQNSEYSFLIWKRGRVLNIQLRVNLFTPSRETGSEVNSIFLVPPQTSPFKDSKLCRVLPPIQCHLVLSHLALRQGWKKPSIHGNWMSSLLDCGFSCLPCLTPDRVRNKLFSKGIKIGAMKLCIC